MDKSTTAQGIGDARFRLLVEAVTDYAIYMLNPDGTIATWNAGARRFKGYDAEEIIGRHFSEFYTPEDRDSGLPARALATANAEGHFEGEGWRVRKDGTRFWTHVVIDAIKSSSCELLGYAKITRDLTERLAADQALRRSEDRFRMLVQSVTDYAIYMLDADGVVSNWNEGARRIKQYSETEIVGQHFSKFYTDEDRLNGEPLRALQTARTEGRFVKEGWRVRKDGSQFWASVVIDAIRDQTGEVIGFAKVTRDITERLESQRALEAAREAFFQSQKMEAIGQLSGGIAHDFNNLLSAVLGSLEMLRKRLPDADHRTLRLLDNAEQGAQRGAALTQRMLAFARRQELKVESVSLADLVADLTDLLRQTLGTRIALEIAVPADLNPVLADSNQLELAILNLVVNSRDAMPEGGVIRVAAKEATFGQDGASPLSGDFICITVSDNGEGMEEDALARAVEPFFTTKGLGKGTGLGLSMVQGLAEQLGGRLRLFSKKGEGTSVELWLPAAATEAGQRSDPAGAAPLSAASGALRILVVDDDALILMNTVDMLEDLGHTTVSAASAREALETFRTEEFDLIITDHSMPGLTGTEFANIIHTDRPNLPIVLATGYAELPDGPSTLPRLAKPFSQNDLSRIIEKVMKR